MFGDSQSGLFGTTGFCFDPQNSAWLLTFFIFLIGHFSSSLRDLAENLGSRGAIIFFNAIYYLLPNLAHFSFIANTASGQMT